MTSLDAALPPEQGSSYLEPLVFERLLKGADFVAATGFAGCLLVKFGPPAQPGFLEFAALASVFLGFCMLVILRELKAYRVGTWVKPVTASLVGASAAALGSLGFWLLTTLTPHEISQGWIVWYAVSLLIYLALSRLMLSVWVKNFAPSDCFRQRVAIVGGGAPAEAAVKILENSAGSEVDVVGI